MEFEVTFTKGVRVGTRSSRTIVVEAATREAAIAVAKRDPEFLALKGYRLTSTFSDNGYEPE